MKNTIKSNLEVNSIFAEAQRSVQETVIVMDNDELPERGSRGRVAYIAGKRLGAAPKRSRAKRVMREAAKKEGAPWPGRRVVLIARERLLSSNISAVQRDIAKALKQLADQRDI